MRVKNSLRNIAINLFSQFVVIILGFMSRKVFIDSLGLEYLGINGLLTSVLSMLSLVEGGIGTSIVYNLYKPLAANDESQITALVKLYKKIYLVLAGIVVITSMGLYPFLGVLMKDGATIPNIKIVYFIFVSKNVISYLNAHKWSLINADQKGYILAKYNLVFNISTTISKIIILNKTQNYILFLLIELLIFVIQNIWNGKIVNERYPYIKVYNTYKVEKSVKENIVSNAKALFLHNIGGYCVFGTDNLLIGKFIGVNAIALYSNYSMITGQVTSLLTPILYGIGSSVGNLIAIESKEKSFSVFKVVHLINFWLYSFSSICIFNLIDPFLDVVFGKGLLLDRFTLLIIVINFYLTGMRICITIFKTRAGIFSNDKYAPLIEALINLLTSIILVKYLGLAGIFIGTTISSVLVPIWIQSKLVYNKVFDKSVFEYFKKYIAYIILTIIVGAITTFACSIVNDSTFISLIIRGCICLIVPNIIYTIVFFKTEEFIYLSSTMKSMIMKFKRKIVLN